MKIAPQKISKLFYNKWPFKVECRIDGAHRISIYGAERTAYWCSTNEPGATARWGYKSKEVDKDNLLKFLNAVAPFLNTPEHVRIRTEGSHFNLFCKDSDLLKLICTNLEEWVVGIHEPASAAELAYILQNGHRKRVCNAYPRERYRYKVFLKSNANTNFGPQFLDWAARYGDAILVSSSTTSWLQGGTRWTQAPFMYVYDGPMLTMVSLYLGNNIRVIEEFILRDSINTV